MRTFLLLASCAALAGSACLPSTAKDAGAQLFRDPRTSGSDLNAFACSTCHAVDDGDARILSGFDLRGAVARSSYWGGYAANMLDATNACVFNFMGGAPLTRDEPKSRALYEYLASLSPSATPGSAPALPLTVVENVTTVARGSPARGAQVWDAACRGCHGDPRSGNGRLTEQASLVPDDSVAFAIETRFQLELVIVEKVRHGAFFGVGGTMPPFPVEQLSDEDLGALMGYLRAAATDAFDEVDDALAAE